MDSSFEKVPVNVPKLSGFDKSHQNLLTLQCGTITPVLCDVLIPGSKVSLDLATIAQLPPLASDTFMRVSLKAEAFFVPMRLLCGSFESWFTDEAKQQVQPGATYVSEKGALPTFGLLSNTEVTNFTPYFDTGTLSDYLGFRSITPTVLSARRYSLMPFLAYHKIYSDWYRNSLVQREVFLPPSYPTYSSSDISNATDVATMPYVFMTEANTPLCNVSTLAQTYCADGVCVFALRQRNFGLDYFTTATPSAQQGTPSVVSFNTSGATGQFSVQALRASNSIQQFRERNNISGNLYVEQLYSRYGVRPSDGIAQRSLFLGSDSFDVYSKGVYQSDNATSATVNTNNPLGKSVGAQYGHGVASGRSHLVEFEAKEPGYLFVNVTLVPRVTYSSGIDRKFIDFVGSGSLSDLANPILQNMGPQPIYEDELCGDGGVGVFGFTDAYAEYKTLNDTLHGLVRDTYSLESFALQRGFAFNSQPRINSNFLEIPTNFMDQVFAVSNANTGFDAWVDCYFDYRVAQPLAKYSLPTLQDPAYEHGKTIVIHRGGFKL